MQQFNENEQKHYKTHAHKAKFATPEQEYEEYSSKTEKKCTKCAIVKTLDKFNGNTSGADPFDKKGYRLRRPECSECTKLAGKGKDVAKKIAKKHQKALFAEFVRNLALLKTCLYLTTVIQPNDFAGIYVTVAIEVLAF